jgi:hypothetical protein
MLSSNQIIAILILIIILIILYRTSSLKEKFGDSELYKSSKMVFSKFGSGLSYTDYKKILPESDPVIYNDTKK